jgi:acyl carrier protein
MSSPEELRSLVAEALSVSVDLITDDVRFEELPDYDSVARLSLLMALADAGVEIELGQASEFQTFGELMRLIAARP